MFWCEESPNHTMTALCLSEGRWSVNIDAICATQGTFYYILHTRSTIMYLALITLLVGASIMIIVPLVIMIGVVLSLATIILLIVIAAIMRTRG